MDKLVCVEDFEREAKQKLSQNALDFYASGADDEITLRENKSAFKRWLIRPRVLRDVSIRDLTTYVLGKKVGFPVGVSPTAMQMLAHPDGEIANARASAAMNTIYILSTRSTSSLEEVAAACPNSRKWFQLYVYKDREHSENMIRRAEAAGFEALVFTVDCPLCGRRRNNLRTKPYVPSHMRLGNFEEMAGGEEQIRRGCSHLGDHDQQYDRTLDWRCLGWLKSVTRLPIIIKGILTPDDARLAISYGASGIFVSNHGGRQLDTVLSTIEALPAIVAEVKGECDVYLDGGVSTGTDVFKALALGAKMVFIGRPALWGLAMGGEQGATRVLEIYKEELDLTMALAGVQSVNQINPKYVTRGSNL